MLFQTKFSKQACTVVFNLRFNLFAKCENKSYEQVSYLDESHSSQEQPGKQARCFKDDPANRPLWTQAIQEQPGKQVGLGGCGNWIYNKMSWVI